MQLIDRSIDCMGIRTGNRATFVKPFVKSISVLRVSKALEHRIKLRVELRAEGRVELRAEPRIELLSRASE